MPLYSEASKFFQISLILIIFICFGLGVELRNFLIFQTYSPLNRFFAFKTRHQFCSRVFCT
ncbi:unnamed protein product [Moneuplotes crassus]|uniref:Uncharacterized protein n=1 Tax=Euplotes crassus TaxID=5936 RepID=A0AAD1XBP9_EUPCR|nr:unnamed protein product [Moneuplotes crassus]